MFGVNQLYDAVNLSVHNIVINQTMWASAIFGIAVFIIALSGLYFFGLRKIVIAAVIAAIIGGLGYNVAKGDLPKKADDIGSELSNIAVNAGVDDARDKQATQLQNIHAVVIAYDVDWMTCQTVVITYEFPSGDIGDCQKVSPWYTTDPYYNPHRHYYQVCKDVDDGKGKSHQECHEESKIVYDTKYTPWFDKLVRYWFIPDTKTIYLHEALYTMVDVNGKPKVYILGNQWRVPGDYQNHRFPGENPDPTQFNSHVPEFWQRIQSAAKNGGTVVMATFIGHYFNWGWASNAGKFVPYTGNYQALLKLAKLSGPTGQVINYTNAFGKPATMHTSLTSRDGDGMPFDFEPMETVGFTMNPESLLALKNRALEIQGNLGPVKQASARWFLVPSSIVNQLGGMDFVTQALKAYLGDESVWGLFKLPKNQVIVVTEISDDGSQILARHLETGMPDGNEIPKERMRMSIGLGQTLPMNSDSLFGSFTGKYQATNGRDLTYEYSKLEQAGGPIGVIYEPTGWTPDPKLDCEIPPPAHPGYIRPRMCADEWRKTDILINADGAELIQRNAEASAYDKCRSAFIVAGLFMVLGLVAAYAAAQNAQP